MKNFRKLEFSPSKLTYEEMKNIKAGTFDQAYGCSMSYSSSSDGGTNYKCSSPAGVCFDSNGSMKGCALTFIANSNQFSCACGGY